MIVARSVAVALLLGLTTVLVGTVVSNPSGVVRLFLRCARWGVATGAVTGAAVGAAAVLAPGRGAIPALFWVGMLVGALSGAIVSLIPALLGAGFITALLRHRHRVPEAGVEGELTLVFRGVVALLDVALVVGLTVVGGVSALAASLPFVVIGNVCVVLMLCQARTSIGGLWSEVAL